MTGACCLAGFVLLNLPQGGAVSIVGVALLCVALAVGIVAIVRVGVGSLADREREASARDHFERTGKWPRD